MCNRCAYQLPAALDPLVRVRQQLCRGPHARGEVVAAAETASVCLDSCKVLSQPEDLPHLSSDTSSKQSESSSPDSRSAAAVSGSSCSSVSIRARACSRAPRAACTAAVEFAAVPHKLCTAQCLKYRRTSRAGTAAIRNAASAVHAISAAMLNSVAAGLAERACAAAECSAYVFSLVLCLLGRRFWRVAADMQQSCGCLQLLHSSIWRQRAQCMLFEGNLCRRASGINKSSCCMIAHNNIQAPL